jgi:hypothetical protein
MVFQNTVCPVGFPSLSAAYPNNECFFFVRWFFVKHTTVLTSHLSHRFKFCKPQNTLHFFFEPLPSCVNHSASDRHLGYVARATAYPPSPPLSLVSPISCVCHFPFQQSNHLKPHHDLEKNCENTLIYLRCTFI